MKKGTSPPSGIIRVEKDRSHPYKTINTSFANDERLSWGARGVLVYLLSKPDDWKVMPKDLIAQSAAGRDAVYAILQNLESCGYLMRVRTRRDDGTFEYSTVIYEVSQPLTAFPYTAEPYTAEPLTVKPYVLTNKEVPTKERLTKEQDARDAALKSLGLRADQRRKVLATQPTLTVDDIAAWQMFIDAPPPWCHTPEAVCFKALVNGDPVPVERTNGHAYKSAHEMTAHELEAHMHGA